MPSLETINLGTVPNDRTGDPLRLAFYKTSNNFSLIYDMSNSAYNRANTIFISGLSVSNINATGTLSNTNYLRGDGTWSPISSLAAGSDGQVQYNNSGILSGATGLTFLAGTLTKIILTQSVVNTGLIIGTGYSLTGSNATSMIDLSGTLNTTGSPDVIALRVTDTARGASTKFLNIYGGASGTTSVFSVDRNGGIVVPTSSTSALALELANSDLGFATLFTANNLGVVRKSTAQALVRFDITGVVATIGSFRIGSALAAEDVILTRDAANTLALRNSTNAQAFNIYNTYTDASNYERGFVKWDTNVLKIGTEKAGTGTARALEFQTGGTTALTIASTTDVTFAANAIITGKFFINTSLIGNDYFLGSNFYAGSNVRLASGVPLGWSSSATLPYSAADLTLFRDAANIHAWRNGTNAQTSRLYATYTDASNGAWSFMDSDVTTAATLTLGTSGNGTGASTLDKFQISLLGTRRLDYGVTTASTWTVSGSLALSSQCSSSSEFISSITGGGFRAGAAGWFYWNNSTALTAPSDGVLRISNQATTGFTGLLLGPSGTTYNRLKHDGAGILAVRLADDSAYSFLRSKLYLETAAAPASASDTGTTGEVRWASGFVYVCTATNTWQRAAIATW